MTSPGARPWAQLQNLRILVCGQGRSTIHELRTSQELCPGTQVDSVLCPGLKAASQEV